MKINLPLLKDLNKVLLIIEDLSNKSLPKREDILYLSSSITLGENKDHGKTLDLLKDLGFISFSDVFCAITPLGKTFLTFNKRKYVELTEGQKEFLLGHLLRKRAIKILLKKIVSKYPFSGKFKIDISDMNLNNDQSEIINSLRWLGILNLDDTLIEAEKDKLIDLVKESRDLNIKDLNQIIRDEITFSKRAEKTALIFERKRLNKFNKPELAKLVKIVGEDNVRLGYDLISFEGKNNDKEYNRFIEVKSSMGSKLRFFWTLNEFQVAKRLKNKYFIYFFSNIKDRPSSPIIYKNPSRYFKPPKYKIISTEFIVEEA